MSNQQSQNQAGVDQSATAKSDESTQGVSGGNEGELQKLQELADKYKNDYLYLRAEFENYRKHVIRERAELQKYAAERVLHDVLGVLDNFERALEAKVTTENLKTYAQGVEMTAAELKSTLSKHGVVEMKSEGVPFDPAVHEALSSEASSAVPEGHVLRVLKKAYKINDKLLRPAQVIVAKKLET